MPIKRELYPENWEAISHYIRFIRAAGRCEGTEYHPDCRATHGQTHPDTGAKVILTTAHLDHNPANNAPDNLAALCQRCHNHYDGVSRQQKKIEGQQKRAEKAGQIPLFEIDETEPISVAFPEELLLETSIIRMTFTGEMTPRPKMTQMALPFRA